MPRYAALIYSPAEDEGRDVPPEVMETILAEYNAFGEAAGDVIAGGEALHDTDTATTVKVKDGKGGEAVFTDGPFAETKEVLGGFYLLDCADLDEALEWARQIPGAWHGKVEVRPCIDFSQGEG
jgi:hypothetical protein